MMDVSFTLIKLEEHLSTDDLNANVPEPLYEYDSFCIVAEETTNLPEPLSAATRLLLAKLGLD